VKPLSIVFSHRSRTVSIASLQGRLAALFLAFALLVSISVAATFWALEAQKQDALIVNLAGRQRMLIQLMSRLALESERALADSRLTELREAERTFEATLTALRDGGDAPDLQDRRVTLPPTRDPIIMAELDRLRAMWADFQPALEQLANAAPQSPGLSAALQNVETQAALLAQQADTIVRLYEASATQKIIWLRRLQIGFFASTGTLLMLGAWMTRASVLRPLVALQAVARRIGGGDLNTPVEVRGPQEIDSLARAFEVMRGQMQTSRQELLDWAETLERRVAQRTQALDALYEVSQEISSRLELSQVLRLITEKARELLGAEVAALCLLQSDGQTLTLGAHSGTSQAVVERETAAHIEPARQVLARREALLCDAEQCSQFCGILSASHRVSHMAAPLRAGGRVIGALCVGSSQPRAFTSEGGRLLTKLANSAAVALENARLYAQAERAATLEERQRIAAEMHDGLAQTLSYLVHRVERTTELAEARQSEEVAQELKSTIATLRQASREVRQSITRLEGAPPRRPLESRLSEMVDEFQKNGGPPVGLEVGLAAPLFAPPEEAEQALRVVREALLNAQRHAQARRIVVRLEQQDDEVRASVQDDGRGFDPQSSPTDDGHFGLSIMRARAARIGGQLTIHSAPGQGTRVTLAWPVRGSE
jgi:two-component system nitrate/nitrite sensor histidine kinase NarX